MFSLSTRSIRCSLGSESDISRLVFLFGGLEKYRRGHHWFGYKDGHFGLSLFGL